MTKHANKTKRPSHPILYIVLIALAIPVIAIGVFLSSFDVNSYRSAIENAAREQTGRTIKLAGPISWSLSFSHGFSLAVKDVSVSNPAWASRPDMARIGVAKLHLNIAALLQKKLDIVAFELGKTDVQLETAANGTGNWDFDRPDATKEKAKPETAKAEGGASPVSVNIREIKITDSRFGMKGKDGKLSLFEVPSLTFSGTGRGIELHFTGKVAGTPVEIDMKGGKLDEMAQANWPFNLQARYDSIKIDARGTLNDNMKRVALDEFMVTSGKSDLGGTMSVALGGARPSITAKLHAKHLDPNDFAVGGQTTDQPAKTTAEKPASGSNGKVFTNDPLPLDGLKAADAHIDLTIDELVAGLTSAQQLSAKVALDGGRLSIDPASAQIAGSKTNLTLHVDAAGATPQLTTSLESNSLDLSQLFKLGGMESAISGKTGVDIAVASSGRSTHEMAAHANGKVNLLMDTGTVSSSVLRDIAGGLLNIFAPGAGSLTRPGINCLAARYVITNGLMDTKGLLIDTEVTTIAGKGYINLPDEKISMSLFTKPKALGITSILPPMRIAGDLTKPSFTLDAAGVVQKLTGLLGNDSAPDGVPTMITAAGKNSCAATLDSPQPVSPTKPLVPGDIGNIKDGVKNVGGKLIEGIGKSLFGN